MDASELLKRYTAGERDFSNYDLKGANLIDAKLSSADLSRANLSKAYLNRANLSKAYLNRANLIDAKLSSANLSRADLSVANLNRANLIDAHLSRADLSEADLSEAYLIGAYLIGAYLIGANLSGANLIGANLSRANLSRADLSEADLNGSNLKGAYLLFASLIGANLSGADLSGANLSEAYLSGANLSRANLSETNLSGADLSGANLIGADLSEADLSGANLSGADLSGANLLDTDLTNTNLSEASLCRTTLAYEKISEELQKENQELKEKLSILETQFEKLVERDVERRLIANQGIKARKLLTWKGMRFRSNPEREMAKVFDEMGVMFFPLPSGRVMTENGMTTREVDFLVCSRGKWGILECDGISHILNSIKKGQMPSAALDHKRDNDFNRHGQWFIKRFTDDECKASPQKVVRQFLDMLHKFHEDLRYQIIGDSAETKSSQSQKKVFLQSEDFPNSDLATHESHEKG
jgi:uncharacterized protein YjbI with pentapeptide repeats/very-short-patch-repair endonuclease